MKSQTDGQGKIPQSFEKMKTRHATPLKGTAKKLLQKVSVKPAEGKRSLRAHPTVLGK
jgi:hypothetical protein